MQKNPPETVAVSRTSTIQSVCIVFRHLDQAKFQQIHQCLPGHDARVHRLWHLGEGAHWSIATRQHREPGFRLMNGQCNQCLQFEAPHACAKAFVQSVVRINYRNDRIMSECSHTGSANVIFVYQWAQPKEGSPQPLIYDASEMFPPRWQASCPPSWQAALCGWRVCHAEQQQQRQGMMHPGSGSHS